MRRNKERSVRGHAGFHCRGAAPSLCLAHANGCESSGLRTVGSIGRCGPGEWHPRMPLAPRDRKSVVKGRSVSVRVDLGGRRIINKNKRQKKKSSNRTTDNSVIP